MALWMNPYMGTCQQSRTLGFEYNMKETALHDLFSEFNLLQVFFAFSRKKIKGEAHWPLSLQALLQTPPALYLGLFNRFGLHTQFSGAIDSDFAIGRPLIYIVKFWIRPYLDFMLLPLLVIACADMAVFPAVYFGNFKCNKFFNDLW